MSERVFISHASHDRATVEREILGTLHALGLSTWYSREEIRSPDDFQQRIRDALHDCSWFLVALSPTSVASRWVKAEVSLAMERLPKRVVPVIIESCDPADCHLHLKLYQYVDLAGDRARGRSELRRAFQAAASRDLEISRVAGEQDRGDGLDRLRSIRETRNSQEIGFIFRSLADAEEGIRVRAQQALHAIGWNAAADAVESLAESAAPSDIEDVLDGLGALESHAEVVGILERLCNLLSAELRNRAILLLERKKLVLQKESIAGVFTAHHSPWRLEKVLGQGLTAASFLATHRHTGLPVVIRTLRPELAAQHRVRFEFLDLLKRTSRYVHENLVTVRDGGQFPTDQLYFAVRDYIPGATLQNLFDKDQELSPREVLSLIRQVALALTPIHKAGECHRGIKPSNIFLTDEHQIILGDASLSLTSVGIDMLRLSYDFSYTAPENFIAGAPVGPGADYYALGCVFYQLICGRPPYVSDSPFELARLHGHQAIIPPSKSQSPWGSLADELIAWLLKPDPFRRPQKPSEILEALTEIENGLALLPGGKSPREPDDQAKHWQEFAPEYSIAGFNNPGDVFHTMMFGPGEMPHEAAPDFEGSEAAIKPQSEDGPPPPPVPRARIVRPQDFLDQLRQSGLLTSERLRKLVSSDSAPIEAEKLAQQLIAEGALTRYQAEALLRGEPLVIGRNYIIEDLIGKGGMGRVYRARHLRMRRTVAVKVLSTRAMHNEDARQRFYQEVEVAATLDHPNIVRAFDADEAGGLHFLVMEYVRGQDLQHIVGRDGPLAVGQALTCIRQAAEGLAHAHQQHVIHRDIKPANLLMNDEGRIKILDMGLARLNNPLTEADSGRGLTLAGSILGTVDYMAPEQAADTTQADARSDIYSLGCTLWYILTGNALYEGSTAMVKLIAHRESPIPSLKSLRDDIPSELAAIFEKMVAKDPRDRYQSMDEVLLALQDLMLTGRTMPPIELKQLVEGSPETINPHGNLEDFARSSKPAPTESFLHEFRNPAPRDSSPRNTVSVGDAATAADTEEIPVDGPWLMRFLRFVRRLFAKS